MDAYPINYALSRLARKHIKVDAKGSSYVRSNGCSMCRTMRRSTLTSLFGYEKQVAMLLGNLTRFHQNSKRIEDPLFCAAV